MSIIQQLDELWTTGRLVLDHPVTIGFPSDTQLAAWIAAREPTYRRQLPQGAPDLKVEWALWACKQVVRAAQLIVYRELGEEFINSGLEILPQRLLTAEVLAASGEQEPFVTDPKLHYSVDVFFRFIPDLDRLARAASGTDPLLQIFQRWATAWPLAGVGIAKSEAEPGAQKLVKNDIFLSTLYADRKLLRQSP